MLEQQRGEAEEKKEECSSSRRKQALIVALTKQETKQETQQEMLEQQRKMLEQRRKEEERSSSLYSTGSTAPHHQPVVDRTRKQAPTMALTEQAMLEQQRKMLEQQRKEEDAWPSLGEEIPANPAKIKSSSAWSNVKLTPSPCTGSATTLAINPTPDSVFRIKDSSKKWWAPGLVALVDQELHFDSDFDFDPVIFQNDADFRFTTFRLTVKPFSRQLNDSFLTFQSIMQENPQRSFRAGVGHVFENHLPELENLKSVFDLSALFRFSSPAIQKHLNALRFNHETYPWKSAVLYAFLKSCLPRYSAARIEKTPMGFHFCIFVELPKVIGWVYQADNVHQADKLHTNNFYPWLKRS
jgi:hypothetical protein